MVRVGVVADTHCPEFLPALPSELFTRLSGVDLILHAGDIGGVEGRETLRQLAQIAPVEAVRGDHDAALTELPLRRELTVAGRRIGLLHGNRSRLLEEPETLIETLSLGLFQPRPRLYGWLRRQFPEADVVIFGHTHVAVAVRDGRGLLFNPGPVYAVSSAAARARLANRPNWFETAWLQVIRHRRDDPVASVGILEFDDDQIRATIHRI
ncbi:MAG: metallophosphoesterase family protein [Candidatus Dormibacteraceae bacterium]